MDQTANKLVEIFAVCVPNRVVFTSREAILNIRIHKNEWKIQLSRLVTRGFPGGPVVRTLPSVQGVQAQSLVRELTSLETET